MFFSNSHSLGHLDFALLISQFYYQYLFLLKVKFSHFFLPSFNIHSFFFVLHNKEYTSISKKTNQFTALVRKNQKTYKDYQIENLDFYWQIRNLSLLEL